MKMRINSTSRKMSVSRDRATPPETTPPMPVPTTRDDQSLRDLIALTDESGTKKGHFLCYGGIFARRRAARQAESALGEFCAEHGFPNREMSWKKCSKAEVPRYADFARQFWTLSQAGIALDFRCMVVDTDRYPIRHPASKANSWEQGFYRFYSMFLSASIDQVGGDSEALQLLVAPRSDRYPHNAQVLEATIGGRLRSRYGSHLKIRAFDWSSPKASRLHQLGEVLLGAVSFRFNRRERPVGTHKAELHAAIEELVGQDLAVDFKPDARPFNVWAWTRPGERRWNEGASGTVGP